MTENYDALIISHEDSDISDEIRKILEDEGIQMRSAVVIINYQSLKVLIYWQQTYLKAKTVPMSSVGRALERDETQGFMKVLVDADTRRFLGAAILGIGCTLYNNATCSSHSSYGE